MREEIRVTTVQKRRLDQLYFRLTLNPSEMEQPGDRRGIIRRRNGMFWDRNLVNKMVQKEDKYPILSDFGWLSVLWGALCLMVFLPPNLAQDSTSPGANREARDYIANPVVVDCSKLRMGQYLCDESQTIDPATQQIRGCTKDNIAKVTCEAVNGLICRESNNRSFEREVPCKRTNGYKYDTALLLSVFLGFLGADRFYLGHVGMGALKFCTLGFFFIGHLLDIILIATQYTTPIDGSHYIVGFYGPAVQSIRANNHTCVVPRPDW